MASRPSDNRYEGFLSYSHAADGTLAPQLQSALHGFAKPWYRLRAIRIFRDKTSLSATPSLWPSIEAALRNSGFLLLMASPDAAKSHWVRKEVETFLNLAGPKRILIILTEGELEWDEAAADFDWRRTNAFPQLGRPVFEEEPLWVDLRALRSSESVSLRNPDFRDAVARLSSALRGIPTDQLIGEDIRHHRKTMRLLWSALVLFALLAAGLAVAGYYSYRKGIEAYNSGVAAQAAARRTRSEFMVSAATTLENDDPLTSGLVLSELDESYQSDRALALLRRVANELPVAVLPGVDPKFSADGSRLLTFPNDNKTVLLWSVDALDKPIVLKGHGGSVTDAAIDGQGRRVAIASDDHTVTVWDVDGPRQVAVITGYAPTYAVMERDSIALSGDGTHVAFLNGKHAEIASATGQDKPVDLAGHSDAVLSVAYSPDGQHVATTSLDRTTRVLERGGPPGRGVSHCHQPSGPCAIQRRWQPRHDGRRQRNRARLAHRCGRITNCIQPARLHPLLCLAPFRWPLVGSRHQGRRGTRVERRRAPKTLCVSGTRMGSQCIVHARGHAHPHRVRRRNSARVGVQF